MTGTFFAIVGPSGAGKDTLIDYARSALQDDPRFAFPRRCITRPADAGGEDHIAVSAGRFAAMKQNGDFILDWQAHGLNYGIPADVADRVAIDISVIANLSRAAIDPLSRLFANACVLHITAPHETIAARLAARGRESAEDIEHRLARSHYTLPDRIPVTTICNDGPVDEAGAEFVAHLRALRQPDTL